MIIHPPEIPTDAMWKAPALALAAACLAFAAGCSGEDEPGASSGSAATQPAQEPSGAGGGASLSISADKTHAVQPGDVITVSVSASGFELDQSRVGEANAPGIGHYRIYLDEASGDDFLAAGAAASTRITLPADTSDGSHELRAALVNNDGSPLEPPVEGRVLLIVYRL